MELSRDQPSNEGDFIPDPSKRAFEVLCLKLVGTGSRRKESLRELREQAWKGNLNGEVIRPGYYYNNKSAN